MLKGGWYLLCRSFVSHPSSSSPLGTPCQRREVCLCGPPRGVLRSRGHWWKRRSLGGVFGVLSASKWRSETLGALSDPSLSIIHYPSPCANTTPQKRRIRRKRKTSTNQRSKTRTHFLKYYRDYSLSCQHLTSTSAPAPLCSLSTLLIISPKRSSMYCLATALGTRSVRVESSKAVGTTPSNQT